MADLLQGKVSERPFPKAIYALVVHGLTGALILEHEGRTWTLWWKGGQIVDADSATPEDALGRVLKDNGLIDAAQLSESLRRMAQSPGQSQLDALVASGALDGEARTVAARTGLVRRALRVFALPEATYRVEATAHDRLEGGPLDARWLIYKGLRSHYDAARLGRDLAPLEPYAIKLLPDVEARLGVFGFGDEERFVLAYLAKGYWSVPDLVDACMSLPGTTVHAVVYTLLACELLDAKPASSVPRLRKRAREETINVSAGKVPMAPRPGPMSVPPPSAPPNAPAIVRAAPPSTPPPSTAPLSTSPPAGAATPARQSGAPRSTTPPVGTGTVQLGPGAGAVAQAQAAASAADPQIRDRIIKKYKDVESGVDLFQVLDVPPTASAADVKLAYFSLAKTFHPDRIAALKVEDLRPQVERVFARMSEAFSVLGDDTRRAEYKKVQAAGGEEAIRKKEAEDEALAMKILGAEEHFRQGEMALRRAQFGQALDEFKLALEMNPDEAEHHAMVAWATFQSAADKKAALQPVKQIFAKALELNDKCVPAYFYLGHVYNFQEDFPRALAQFKRALQLRPGFTDAEREIRVIEMRAQKGGLGKSAPSMNPFRKR